MSPGVAARVVGVPASTLRYWGRSGYISVFQPEPGKERRYLEPELLIVADMTGDSTRVTATILRHFRREVEAGTRSLYAYDARDRKARGSASPATVPERGSYIRIAQTLRDRITHGHILPGTRFTSEAKLSAEFDVVRTTLRRALALLKAEGLLTPVPGIGWIVGDSSVRTTASTYSKITEDLHRRILDGRLKPGDRMPSEMELVREYGVSRWTVREAMAVLMQVGLIETVHGKGRFVAERRP
jgi:DNA-binding GntR family transcriptional regulator